MSGALAGLFDGPTTINVDWRAPIQSLSLSRLEPLGDEAVGIALTCLNSWGRAMREMAEPGDVRIVVRDEAWKQLRLGPEAVKSFDADLRLSRRDGDIQWAVAHKPSDLLSVGDQGSQAVSIAKDLLHLADIKVLHGQDPGVAAELETLLGLGPIAQDLITGWAMQGTRTRAVVRRRTDLQGPDGAPPPRAPPHLHQHRPRKGTLTWGNCSRSSAPDWRGVLTSPLLLALVVAVILAPAAQVQQTIVCGGTLGVHRGVAGPVRRRRLPDHVRLRLPRTTRSPAPPSCTTAPTSPPRKPRWWPPARGR